jgi:hypothetical protein
MTMEEVHKLADLERIIFHEKGETSSSILDFSFVCENQRKVLLSRCSNSLRTQPVDVDSKNILTQKEVVYWPT